MKHAESDPQPRVHLAESHHAAEGHPSLEDLAAYHDGLLPPDRAAAVREHIVHCDACIEVVLELGEQVAEETVPEVGEFAVAAAWRSQRARLRAEHALPRAEPWLTPRPLGLLAAALAIVCLGLAGWVVTLRQALDEQARPQVNPPLVSLTPLGALRDPAAAMPTVGISSQGERVWLILNLDEDVDYPDYRVRCILPGGKLLWTLDGLQRTPAGNFRIELPAHMLPAGDLQIILSGVLGSELIPIAEYRLRSVNH